MDNAMISIRQQKIREDFKKETYEFVKKDSSLRKMLHMAKERFLHAVSIVLHIKAKYLEEEKRNTEIVKELERLKNIKRDGLCPKYKTVFTQAQPNYGRQLKQQISAKPVVYNQKLDKSYIRSEKDVEETLELIKRIRNLKIDMNSLRGRKTRNLKTMETEQTVLSTEHDKNPVTETPIDREEKIIVDQKEKDTKPKKETKSVCFKPYLIKIQQIDTYIEQHKESQDCETQLMVRKYKDVRKIYLVKMAQPFLAAMCAFNHRLSEFIMAVQQGELDENAVRESLQTMNSNYEFLQYIHVKYMKQEEVKEVLSSINVKVCFINKQYMIKEPETKAVVKQKVA